MSEEHTIELEVEDLTDDDIAVETGADDEAVVVDEEIDVMDEDDADDADADEGDQGELRFDDAVEKMVEALLFAAAGPLSLKDLEQRLPDSVDVPQALASLQQRYAGRGVELVCVAERWCFRTSPDFAYLMTEERTEPRRLSKAALETLAIVAYHQPVTRAEIEQVRGVSLSKGTLDILLEMNFVRLRGRKRTPGRPVTYGTSDLFLEHFGLANLMDLPGAPEMKAAGLLDMNLPSGFEVPQPGSESADEDPIEDGEGEDAEFAQDFIGEPDKPQGEET